MATAPNLLCGHKLHSSHKSARTSMHASMLLFCIASFYHRMSLYYCPTTNNHCHVGLRQLPTRTARKAECRRSSGKKLSNRRTQDRTVSTKERITTTPLRLWRIDGIEQQQLTGFGCNNKASICSCFAGPKCWAAVLGSGALVISLTC